MKSIQIAGISRQKTQQDAPALKCKFSEKEKRFEYYLESLGFFFPYFFYIRILTHKII